ncbi:MAG: ATP-dependent phosphofructokinase / diphosphate-dependent phosphofructokinase [Bacteroidales bacterium]|nr:ATP-dependent phosphofructokinase / diphosphate-dependent phosphofructokinase [Bacteroidales bacterium]
MQHKLNNMGKPKRIGILTAGGDCPGINAAIRGVGKTAIVRHGMEVIGISSGFAGLIHKEVMPLGEGDLSGILTLGGTILGTSREKPFKKKGNGAVDKPKLIKKNYKDLKLDCLVCIGGNGTQKTAWQLSEEGLNVIGIPKTIDNDVFGTDFSFGFDSALTIATEAIDRLHTTANSHKRIMVIEVMGHHAGWLTLYAGMAGGGDVILIPELEYNPKAVNRYLLDRAYKKKPYSIVVVAEGIAHPEGQSAADYVAHMIEKETHIETRKTVLGYIQRGGSPSANDRILATRFGSHAVDLIAREDYGRMVVNTKNETASIPLADVAGKTRLVPENHSLIQKAKSLDICMGSDCIILKS